MRGKAVTLWNDTMPGAIRRRAQGVPNVIQGDGEALEREALLICSGLPDHVRVPPELGGGTTRPLRFITTPECYRCGDRGTKHGYDLANGMCMHECEACRQFVWFRPKPVDAEPE